MSVLKSLCSAFLMYSRIPVPQVEWKEENRRYALCFFPLIGVFIAAFFLLWNKVCALILEDNFIFAVGCTIIPIIITGGIHIDGFCDVNDALASCAPREKKFEIMKDPHIGSFAIIRLSVYFLIQTALFYEIKNFFVLAVCALGYVQSRAWSGLAVMLIPNAKKSGSSLQCFTESANKKITIASEALYLFISSAAMICLAPICGISAILCGIGAFVYFNNFTRRIFGGITGDISGYFLQLCEIWIIAGAVFSELITEAIL